MYKQTLYSVEKYTGSRKKFKYGYDQEVDAVIISKDGTLGEIYTVQGLRIGLPKSPKTVYGSELSKPNQVFQQTKRPESLKKLKTIHDFHNLSEDQKKLYYDYINKEFDLSLIHI